MSTIRKHRQKWQVLIRRKDHPQISKCFVSKEAARRNNLAISVAALSAVTVFGIILTL